MQAGVRRYGMRAASVVLVLAFIAGSDRTGSGAVRASQPADGAVSIVPGQDSYRIGEPISAAIVNLTPGTILSGGFLCGDVWAEREIDGRWEPVPNQTGLCPFQVVVVHPGESRVEALVPVETAGTYRLGLRFYTAPRYDEPNEVFSALFLAMP